MSRITKAISVLTLVAMTASMGALPASAYLRFEGNPPDPTGTTLYLDFENTDGSIVFNKQVVADGLFDDMTDFYGMTNSIDGTVITEENIQEVWMNAYGGEKNPNYKWEDWTYANYSLTCVHDDTGEAVWEDGKYRAKPDFPVEKELIDSGYYIDYGKDTEQKVSDKSDYHFQERADGTLKWTNGIQSRPELDVCYTVLSTKMEAVFYTRNDAEPLPIDNNVYKTIVEQDLYLSSFRGFSNAYSLVYEGEFAYPTIYDFSQTKLPEEYKGDKIHYRLVDMYNTGLIEDGYLLFNKDGSVKDRFVERSGMISPDGKAGLTLVFDETPIQRDYFWPTEVPMTKIDAEGNEVDNGTFAVPQAEFSGVVKELSEETLLGDADCNGKVDIIDVITVNKTTFGKDTISDQGLINCDLNRNDVPDATDSLIIMKMVVGLLTEDEVMSDWA